MLCDKCNKDVELKIEERPLHYPMDNYDVDFIEQIAICPECGEITYTNKIRAENYRRFTEAREKAAAKWKTTINKKIEDHELYCPVCQQNVTFFIQNTPITYFIDNTNVSIMEKDAICADCGEKLWDDDLWKENQEKFEEEMRRKKVI